VVGSLLYSLVRVLLNMMATSHGDQAKLQAEVLVLRRQVQVLERQIKRVRWSPGDRMVLAAVGFDKLRRVHTSSASRAVAAYGGYPLCTVHVYLL
jgi:hypothetical protein